MLDFFIIITLIFSFLFDFIKINSNKAKLFNLFFKSFTVLIVSKFILKGISICIIIMAGSYFMLVMAYIADKIYDYDFSDKIE
ncbi:MAG: hypothetical protein PT934_06495 [Peptoniphilaceae bacterium]|uniref:hypothetical protein n=1 Tax=Parvimonas sp. TaxID=1944660 RepID=UPI0025FB2DF0|nr:hypothetical protein [Parvimonas sp.]MCI5997346.1 hypothetical protein [Parvimonas sp.]MDD7765401.1 hypothetical protein [Peptoniphilaceae bacterium]MDY3050667.1 hypothetical protein [Parvimonas sp.]